MGSPAVWGSPVSLQRVIILVETKQTRDRYGFLKNKTSEVAGISYRTMLTCCHAEIVQALSEGSFLGYPGANCRLLGSLRTWVC